MKCARFLAPIASGISLGVASLQIGLLGILSFIALVPIAREIQEEENFKPLRWPILMCGLIYHGIQFHWILLTYPRLGLPFSISCFLLISLLGGLLFFLFLSITWLFVVRKQHILIFSVPAVYVILEFLRAQGRLGTTWGQLGYSLANQKTLIQVADILGVYGISYCIILINWIIALALGFLKRRRPLPAVYILSLGISVLSVIFMYGLKKKQMKQYALPIYVGVVQPQSGRQNFHQLEQELLDNEDGYRANILVWPEAHISDVIPVCESCGNPFARTCERELPLILVGATTLQRKEEDDGWYLFNSALVLNSNANIVGTYNKMRLVPFAEFLPFSKLLHWLGVYEAKLGNHESGNKPETFSLREYEFGVMICSEAARPEIGQALRRQYAMFILNIANMKDFEGTVGVGQHLSMLIFRAIENRVYVIQSATADGSLFVDPVGRSVHKMNNKSIVAGRIYAAPGESLYTKCGNWFISGCAMLVLVETLVWKFLRGSKTFSSRTCNSRNQRRQRNERVASNSSANK